MARSFRGALALRFGALAAAGMGLCVLVTWVSFRHILDAELNASILNVASIQAAALTDHEAGEMRFHEWELTPEEAGSVVDLLRYAQVWSEAGESLLRSQYMLEDLPIDPVALSQAAGGALVWREGGFTGYRIRSVFYPLVRLGALHDEHVLQVAAPLQTRDAMLRWIAWFGVALVLLTALGGMLGGRWLASRALRPVNDIIRQAEGLGAPNLEDRISAYADTSEYRRLVQVLNTMLSRIQTSFEAQRRFTADASHELRTPLTAMRGEIELALRRERQPAEYRETLESAHEETLRMTRIVEGLLTLARTDAGAIELQRDLVDLSALAAEAVERATGAEPSSGPPATAGPNVHLEAPEPVPGMFDGRLLAQAIWNLVMNARRFAGVRDSSTPGIAPGIAPGIGSGQVLVTVAASGTMGVITVEDSGPGVALEQTERVFSRFWQADPSRTPGGPEAGVGLGLSIVQAIVIAHGGTVTVGRSAKLGGAAFRIQMPLSDRESPQVGSVTGARSTSVRPSP